MLAKLPDVRAAALLSGVMPWRDCQSYARPTVTRSRRALTRHPQPSPVCNTAPSHTVDISRYINISRYVSINVPIKMKCHNNPFFCPVDMLGISGRVDIFHAVNIYIWYHRPRHKSSRYFNVVKICVGHKLWDAARYLRTPCDPTLASCHWLSHGHGAEGGPTPPTYPV